MSDEQQMSDAFKARMRQGLSTMAVRERMRERARNRAIAGGALAAVVIAAGAVLGVQVLAGGAAHQDMAGPGTSTTAEPTAPPAPGPTEAPEPTETEPTETAPAEPTPPPGFDGVAAGEPLVTSTIPLESGDAGAGGGYDPGQVERRTDIYVLCEGTGTVSLGDEPWIDCTTLQPGTVAVHLDRPYFSDWDDDELVVSDDFDGVVREVPAGEAPAGTGTGGTATVHVICFGDAPTVVGGVSFECSWSDDDEQARSVAAWGVPFGPDELVPRITERNGFITFVIER